MGYYITVFAVLLGVVIVGGIVWAIVRSRHSDRDFSGTPADDLRRADDGQDLEGPDYTAFR